jgi:putative membrane protein
MIVVAAVLALLAAAVHVYIFVLETLRWEAPATRRVFGTTVETAAITRALAANQGVYNLLLAVVAAAGAVLVLIADPTSGERAAGDALLVAGLGSMTIAAGYLVATDRSKARAAAVQGTFPVLGLVALAIATALA